MNVRALKENWCPRRDSNPEPTDYETVRSVTVNVAYLGLDWPQRGRLRSVVGCVSLTVTLKLQVVPVELVQVTIVSPTGKKYPEG
jgi:hypothetical protein